MLLLDFLMYLHFPGLLFSPFVIIGSIALFLNSLSQLFPVHLLIYDSCSYLSTLSYLFFSANQKSTHPSKLPGQYWKKNKRI